MARYLKSDEEWAFFERFIPAILAQNGSKPTNHRLILDGFFWIAGIGAPWRDILDEFGNWTSVYRLFRRWTLTGMWDQIMDALNESGAAPYALQTIDSTVMPAHHQAAGAQVGFRTGLRPLSRWLYDQDPPPSERVRLAP